MKATLCAVTLAAALGGIVISHTLAAPRRPTRTVYAWFPARFGSWKTDGISWDCLTHLCFRAVEIKADGSLREPSGDPPKEFVDTAHRHGVKVTVLAWVTRTEESEGYLSNAPEQTARNLLAYVQRNHLDGVNIDDERMPAFNRVAQQPNRELVTHFFQTLSRTFKAADPAYHVSFAAPPVISAADRYGTSWLDLKAIAAAVDAIIPMGYELNPPSIGWTTNPEPLTGAGKAAHTTTRDQQTMVQDYLQAMGGHPEKLLVGVSLDFGGYEWRCRTDQPLSPTLAPGTRKTLAECQANAKQFGERWHEAQQSPWYVHPDGDAFIQGWFSDPRAWNARLAWINQQHLAGIGLWVLDGVNDPPQRWDVLRAWRRAQQP